MLQSISTQKKSINQIPTIDEMDGCDSRFMGQARPTIAAFFIIEDNINDFHLDPPYQRPDVWTDEQRGNFIRSLLFGVPIPPVVINSCPDQKDGFSWNVIDGKQRLTSLFRFVKGELSVDGYTYETLPKRLKNRLFHASLPTIETKFKTIEEEETYYNLFNYSGTTHQR